MTQAETEPGSYKPLVKFLEDFLHTWHNPYVTSTPSEQITVLLKAWSGGDDGARDQLFPAVYEELRRVAAAYMKRERQGHTLQTTAVVHEVYLKLVDLSNTSWEDRTHFFALAAQMMRRILVDAGRKRAALKHGGRARHIALDEVPDVSVERATELIEVDEALNRLAGIDPRKARVVELRFFGGLSVKETAAVLKISEQSVLRDWRLAKAWLLQQLTVQG